MMDGRANSIISSPWEFGGGNAEYERLGALDVRCTISVAIWRARCSLHLALICTATLPWQDRLTLTRLGDTPVYTALVVMPHSNRLYRHPSSAIYTDQTRSHMHERPRLREGSGEAAMSLLYPREVSQGQRATARFVSRCAGGFRHRLTALAR